MMLCEQDLLWLALEMEVKSLETRNMAASTGWEVSLNLQLARTRAPLSCT